MVGFEEANRLKNDLKIDYQERHQALRKLRGYWHGTEYWRPTDDNRGLASLFKDLRGEQNAVGPDIKLVKNTLQRVCVQYQSFLTPLPMIRVPVEAEGNTRRKQQAARKERYLYGLWNQRPIPMSVIANKIGWYLPLMGDCFLGAHPDLDDKLIRPVLRSPEYAYPVLSYDGVTLDTVLFCWEVPESRVRRDYPDYTPRSERRKRSAVFGVPLRGRPKADPKVEVLEFSDRNEICRWVDGEKVNGAEHDFGFNLFDQLSFIHVPDEPFNHGAVEQAVNMVEAGNALYSLLMQSVLDNVFPMLVLEDPAKAPEEIAKGSGSVLPLNPGGKAYYLSPPVQSLGVQTGFMAENEREIQNQTGMPRVSLGDSRDLGSIVTGKAINELQGAGTGSTVEMVQGIGIGVGMVSWNEKALVMGRRMFANDTINLEGYETGSALTIAPRYFTLSLKGKELVGSPRNEVIFSPHLGLPEKLVMNLQAMGANLVSKQHAREQMGIPDSQQMDEEIMGERIQDMVLAGLEAQLQAAPTAENAQDVETRASGLIAGRTAPALQAGAPPIGVAAPAPAPPAGAPSLPPTEPAAPPAASSQFTVTLEQAIQAFASVTNVQGRAFLVGEIVAEGRTDDEIEVALTNPDDKEPIVQALPQFQGRLVFHTVQAEPSEQHVEVSPGVEAVAAGEEPSLEALLA